MEETENTDFSIAQPALEKILKLFNKIGKKLKKKKGREILHSCRAFPITEKEILRKLKKKQHPAKSNENTATDDDEVSENESCILYSKNSDFIHTEIFRITVTCYFKEDIEKIVKRLEEEKKIRILRKKNYVKSPKKNGYSGYCLVLKVPVKAEKFSIRISVHVHTLGMEYWMNMRQQMTGEKKKDKQQKKYAQSIEKIEKQIKKEIGSDNN